MGDDDPQPEYIDYHFLPVSGEDSLIWKPYDFEVQMNDNNFKTLIHKIKIQRNFYKEGVERTLRRSQGVLESLKQELNISGN